MHTTLSIWDAIQLSRSLGGALKLKEIRISMPRLSCRRMKHGPIALVDAEMPVVVIATPEWAL